MKYSNKMSDLTKKISNRLGIEAMMQKLPENIDRYKWVELIQNEVVELYSRYFPHVITYAFIPREDFNSKNNAYTIKKDFIKNNNITVIGIKGYTPNSSYSNQGFLPDGLILRDGYNSRDLYSQSLCELSNPHIGLKDPLIDIYASVANEGLIKDPIIFEFYPPFSFRVTNRSYQDMIKGNGIMEIELLVVHPKSLFTLSPSQMELFEDLATCKIAEFLYGHLKYFDGIESGYQTIDLKLDSIQDWMGRLDNVLEIIRDSYISVSNHNQDLFFMF